MDNETNELATRLRRLIERRSDWPEDTKEVFRRLVEVLADETGRYTPADRLFVAKGVIEIFGPEEESLKFRDS